MHMLTSFLRAPSCQRGVWSPLVVLLSFMLLSQHRSRVCWDYGLVRAPTAGEVVTFAS